MDSFKQFSMLNNQFYSKETKEKIGLSGPLFKLKNLKDKKFKIVLTISCPWKVDSSCTF